MDFIAGGVFAEPGFRLSFGVRARMRAADSDSGPDFAKFDIGVPGREWTFKTMFRSSGA